MPARPLPRGVYLAPYRDLQGRKVVLIVNRQRRRVHEISVSEWEDEDEAVVRGRALLEVLDPHPSQQQAS